MYIFFGDFMSIFFFFSWLSFLKPSVFRLLITLSVTKNLYFG